MDYLEGYKEDLIAGGLGVVGGFLIKKLFKKEIIPVSDARKIVESFALITVCSIGGKEVKEKWKLPRPAQNPNHNKMGNCVKKSRDGENLRKYMNEHCHIQTRLKAGVNVEKTPEGEIVLGFRCGIDTKKDKEYSSVDHEVETPNIEE